MIEIAIKVTLAYLLGSLMGGLIVGRLRGGVDIRTLGSGNAGGTNALRTQGAGFAFWVMLIDIGKGYLASAIIANLNWHLGGAASLDAAGWLPSLCGLAAIIGHIYPLWFGFRGGKGVATIIGVVLGIKLSLLAPMLLTWLLVIMICGYVGLSSILATASLPAYIAWGGIEPFEPLITFALLVLAIVIYTHRGNLARMRAGSEPRARRLWLLGRRHG